MDEIGVAINEMILQLKSLCPVLIPSIFPSNRVVESFNQLFTDKSQIGIRISIITINASFIQFFIITF